MEKLPPGDSNPNYLRRIKEQGLSELEGPIFNVFDVALRTGAEGSEDVAARELDRLCPSTQLGDEVELYLWTLWNLLIDIAKAVPHDSGRPGQETLVTILSRLRGCAKGHATIWGSGFRLWRDLPLLGPCMRESWIDPAYNGGIPDPESARAWRNLNSFAARCLGEGLISWDIYALWQLRAALEEEQLEEHAESGSAAAECTILAASEWIFHSGKALLRFAQDNNEGSKEDEEPSVAAGKLYHGRPGLCQERWTFWKGRFDELGREGAGEIQVIARRAAENMSAVETEKGLVVSS